MKGGTFFVGRHGLLVVGMSWKVFVEESAGPFLFDVSWLSFITASSDVGDGSYRPERSLAPLFIGTWFSLSLWPGSPLARAPFAYATGSVSLKQQNYFGRLLQYINPSETFTIALVAELRDKSIS